MKRILTTDWHAARIFRVAIGTAALAYGILRHDNLLSLAGSFLLFMGVSNTGCGASGCSIPGRRTHPSGKAMEDTTFEEVKS